MAFQGVAWQNLLCAEHVQTKRCPEKKKKTMGSSAKIMDELGPNWFLKRGFFGP